MAELVVKTDNIIRNIQKIDDFFKKQNIKWSLVSKVLSGDKQFIRKILTDDVISKLHSVGESRLSSLKTIKEINPELVTIYIKPPPANIIKSLVKYADISVNTSLSTIEALNREARKINKIH
jgi:ornithine racemase